MRRFRLKHLSPLLALALFCLALLVMNRALGEGSYRDILDHLSALPPQRLLLAVALTILSYSVLTLYDHLASRYLGRSLGWLRTSVASFISYAFSRNIGFTFLTGGSIRYRFYSSWGLSAEEVTRLVGFAAGSFALGLLTVGGVVALSPVSLPAAEELPLEVLRPAGGLALTAVAAYLGMIFFRRRPLRLRGWRIPLPAPRHAVAQILLGSLDWLLTAIVLYALLSGVAPISLAQYLQIYLLAQLTALVSHVPGGLGVFETVILLLVPQMPRSELMGILLAYRAIYFLLPFAVSILLLGIMEGVQQHLALRRAGSWMGRWLSSVAPAVIAGAVLVSGALLLLSSVAPTARSHALFPLEAPPALFDGFSFLAGGVGAGLLLMARGVQRRLAATYRPTLLLLAAGMVSSISHVGSLLVPSSLAFVLFLLILGRGHFDRHFRFFDLPFPPGWVTAVLLITTAAVGLLIFSHPSLLVGWRERSMVDLTSPSLWALGGASSVFLLYAILRLYRQRPPGAEPVTGGAVEKVASLAARASYTSPAVVLAGGGSSLLMNEQRSAALLYGRQGAKWIAWGDPLGEKGQRRELAWKFLEMCEREGGLCAFFEVGAEDLSAYLEMGLVLQPVGDEAAVPLGPDGDEEGGDTDLCLEVFPAEDASAARPALEEILTSMGFSNVSSSRLPLLPVALVQRRGEPVAFSLLCPGGGGEELGFGPLHHIPGPSLESFSFLVNALKAYGAKEGYSRLNLGLVPLEDWEEGPFAALWREFAPELFRHGAHFGGPDELRSWAQGQNAVYSRRSIAFSGGGDLPRIVKAVAALKSSSKMTSG